MCLYLQLLCSRRSVSLRIYYYLVMFPFVTDSRILKKSRCSLYIILGLVFVWFICIAHVKLNHASTLHLCFFVLFNLGFLAFDFCLFCVVIRFFHPRHNGQWPPTANDFYTIFYPLNYFLILNLEKFLRKSHYFPF